MEIYYRKTLSLSDSLWCLGSGDTVNTTRIRMMESHLTYVFRNMLVLNGRRHAASGQLCPCHGVIHDVHRELLSTHGTSWLVYVHKCYHDYIMTEHIFSSSENTIWYDRGRDIHMLCINAYFEDKCIDDACYNWYTIQWHSYFRFALYITNDGMNLYVDNLLRIATISTMKQYIFRSWINLFVLLHCVNVMFTCPSAVKVCYGKTHTVCKCKDNSYRMNSYNHTCLCIFMSTRCGHVLILYVIPVNVYDVVNIFFLYNYSLYERCKPCSVTLEGAPDDYVGIFQDGSTVERISMTTITIVRELVTKHMRATPTQDIAMIGCIFCLLYTGRYGVYVIMVYRLYIFIKHCHCLTIVATMTYSHSNVCKVSTVSEIHHVDMSCDNMRVVIMILWFYDIYFLKIRCIVHCE